MAYLGSQHRRKTRQNHTQPPNRKKKSGGVHTWFSGIDWNRFRFYTVAVLFCFVWGSLWVRAAYIQLWTGPYLAEKARRQHMSAETVSMPRGMIFDRNGHILARSVECRSVYANPGQITDVENTAKTLASLLSLKVEDLRLELGKSRGFVWIKRRIDDATAESVRLAELPGINLSREFERIYPYRHTAGQLLGFVGMEGKGLEGIERSFDSELSGLSMRQVVQRDASGRQFYVDSKNETPVAGDVRLTLDLQVQAIAEEEIARIVDEVEAKWGGVLVADVKSGDVLAWAQYPFFNPNSYRQYSPSEYRNRLAQDALEPGSSFKPFLLAAALQEGIVSRDTVYDCEGGSWKTRTITVRDDGRRYKNLTVAQILSLSSNIGCGKIGLELGAVRYQRYLSRLGFGERTGLQVTETKGILRAPRDWSESDVISASFGQSIAVTVAQMAQAYMTIASEGLYKPLRLIIEDVEVTGGEQRIFSKNTTREVLQMMREVVDTGTGKRAAIPGISVAGKTGTAQKADRRGGAYGRERTASFVGMVPSDKPQYLVIIMIDEPSRVKYGGMIAAPVFKEVASRVMAYHGSLPDPGALTPAQAKAQERAEARAEAKERKTRSNKKEETIMGEVRRGLTPVKPVLETKDSGEVPDVIGQSVRRAVEMFARQGLVPTVKGEGARVVRQTPAPDVRWKEKHEAPQECVIWLSDSVEVAS